MQISRYQKGIHYGVRNRAERRYTDQAVGCTAKKKKVPQRYTSRRICGKQRKGDLKICRSQMYV